MRVQHRVGTERGLPPQPEQDEGEIWGSAEQTQPAPRPFEGHTRDEIWGRPATTIAVVAEIPPLEAIWGTRSSHETSHTETGSVRREPFLLADSWAAAPRKLTWRRRLGPLARLSRRTG